MGCREGPNACSCGWGSTSRPGPPTRRASPTRAGASCGADTASAPGPKTSSGCGRCCPSGEQTPRCWCSWSPRATPGCRSPAGSAAAARVSCWCRRSARRTCATTTTSTPRVTGSTRVCSRGSRCSTPKGCTTSMAWDRATRCGARRGCARASCSGARSHWRGSTRCWSCSGQSGWRPSAPTSPTRPRCVSLQPDTPVPTP